MNFSLKSPSNEITWVIGYGQFGKHAVDLLLKSRSPGIITVVENRPICGKNLPANVKLVQAEGIDWFNKEFTSDSGVTRIIPSLPVHLAANWVKARLALEGFDVRPAEIPDTLLSQLPNPARLTSSSAVTSHADFHCPLHCPEPANICTHTGMRRPDSLYHVLEEVHCSPFTAIIIRSRQFAPGLGGFLAEDLWHLLDRTRSLPDIQLLIGTACKCHGIVEGICHS